MFGSEVPVLSGQAGRSGSAHRGLGRHFLVLGQGDRGPKRSARFCDEPGQRSSDVPPFASRGAPGAEELAFDGFEMPCFRMVVRVILRYLLK